MESSPIQTPLAFIIEDTEDLAYAFSIALESAGFETKTFHDGAMAQHQLKNDAPDVVILDINLPNVTGEELLQQIRSEKHLAKTKVVIVSADPHRAKLLEEDSTLVLIKPVGFSQLRALCARLIPKL